MVELPPLPADFVVAARGLGEERHVLLSIDGTQFELHPDDAGALGEWLVHVSSLAAAEPDPRQQPLFQPEVQNA